MKKRASKARSKPSGAAQRLRELEQLHDAVMSSINEGVYDWDVEKNTIDYSERVVKAVGLPRELMNSTADWRSRIHPDDLPRYLAAILDHFKGKTPRFECDYRYRALDGSWHWARQHGVGLRHQSGPRKGRVYRVIGSTGDITALKQAEERYALATAAAVEGIYEWNLVTGSLFLSDRAKAFFGIAGEELTPAAWNVRVHAEDFERYRAAFVDHFKGRTPHIEIEYRVADDRGGYKWVLERGVGVRDANGRVTRLMGGLSDVTRRKQAEMELRRAHEEAQEALEQQTATAEVLRVMSGSAGDQRPVLQAILANASRLCEASFAAVFLYDGETLVNAAQLNASPGFAEYLRRMRARPGRETTTRRCALERRTVHTPDLINDAEYAPPSDQRRENVRTALSVPMLRDGLLAGVITLWRSEVRPFSAKQISLVETFAHEAVIAIDNVRLFNDTRDALEQLKASAEVLQVISSSITDTAPVFDKILDSCQQLFAGTIVGLNLVREDGMLHIGAYHGEHRDEFERIFPIPLTRASGSGLAILERRVIHYRDAQNGAEVPERTRQGCRTVGIQTAIFAPVLWEGRGLGAIWVGRDHINPFSDREISLLRTFADQAAIAIENVRLFKEIQQKSRQLEAASRHKSEFLANMSHELRTPLNAIIGFTRIVKRRSADQLEPQQAENLDKILASGQHLLALINSILDLAKIEAGRLDVQAADVALPAVLEQCVRTVEPLVKGDTVQLVKEFDGTLPAMFVDEEKLRQIVINLLSNAVKFTEQGSVRVRAQASNGSVAIAVSDTGIGIPPDKLDVIFQEFEQADASSTRTYGGTGLGLAIARRLARLMGGDVTAESVFGSGSTFRLTLPVRYREAA